MKETQKLFLAILIMGLCLPVAASDAKLTADEVVAKHLESIGTSAAREAAQSRLAQGKAQFNEVLAHMIHLDGTANLLSSGHKMKCSLQFGAPQYPGEQFVYTGTETQVAMTNPGVRSQLGGFLNSQTDIMREGLWGGTLFTSWALLDLKARTPRLKYEGLKKVNGRELHDLSYVPKKRGGDGELIIHLYFEPETFRHVLTVYNLKIHDASGKIQEGTDEKKTTVEERFDDFKVVDGLTLPAHWDIRYRVEPQDKPTEFQWDVVVSSVAHNAI